MAEYMYHCYVYHTTTDVVGIDPVAEAANTLDFETNYKSQTVEVNDIIPATTTFEIIKTYTDFKALIDGVNILWTDVKHANEGKAYDIYLITDAPV